MSENRIVLWIFGAQRSGTTATLKGLDQMTRSVLSFGEMNDIIHDPTRMEGINAIRLKPKAELEAIFEKQQAKVLVAKPLMESQRARGILDEFPDSIGIWLMRNYRAVANSMIAKGWPDAGFVQLRHIAEGRGSWRDEGATAEVVVKVQELLKTDLQPPDACSLAWWARNTLLFDQALQNHERVVVLQYEKLVSDPAYLPHKLEQLGVECELSPDFYHKKSLEKGQDLEVCAPVAALCDELMGKLVQVEEAEKSASRAIGTLKAGAELDPPKVAGWRALPGLRQIYREKARVTEWRQKFEEMRVERAAYKRRYEALRQRFDALNGK